MENSLFEEKYRPKDLDDYLCDEVLKERIQEYITLQDIPHLLFYGRAGIGKTTLAKMLAAKINCDVLYLCASDENGIDTVRSKIKSFASTASFRPLKIVIMDESDNLTADAQEALRNVIDKYNYKTRFIFTCNYIEKMTEPLLSRCSRIEFTAPKQKQIAKRLVEVCETEKIEFELSDLVKIVKTCYPDIRQTLIMLQDSIRNNKLVIKTNVEINGLANEILEKLKIKTGFNEIRQIIADNSIKSFHPLYRYFYDHVEELSAAKTYQTVIDLAEYEYMDYFVPDKEINFMAFIAKYMQN